MKKMSKQEARQMFEQVESNLTDPKQIDTVRMVKEFFTNPDFAKAVANMVADMNDQK